MSQFLRGLAEGRFWAWALVVILAVIAACILVKELNDRKARMAKYDEGGRSSNLP